MVHFQPLPITTDDFRRCLLRRKTTCQESPCFENPEFAAFHRFGSAMFAVGDQTLRLQHSASLAYPPPIPPRK